MSRLFASRTLPSMTAALPGDTEASPSSLSRQCWHGHDHHVRRMPHASDARYTLHVQGNDGPPFEMSVPHGSHTDLKVRVVCRVFASLAIVSCSHVNHCTAHFGLTTLAAAWLQHRCPMLVHEGQTGDGGQPYTKLTCQPTLMFEVSYPVALSTTEMA